MDFIELFEKAIKAINDIPESYTHHHVMFAHSEEEKAKLREWFPSYDIQVLPQCFKCNKLGEDTIYIIPVENNKPIKFIVEMDKYD